LIGIVQHTETAEHTFGWTCVEHFNSWSLPRSAGQIKAMTISGFHCALLQPVTLISQLMHSILQNVDVKIYVV